jgi:hypothetical protein
MRRLLLAFSLLLTCFGAAAQGPQASQPQPVTTPNLAGKVELVEGDVTVHDRSKKPRKVAVGDTILEGEGIVTGKDGELHLNMEDGGFIAVRPNTKMRIVAYQAQGDEGDKGVFSLLQGTFRSVTGWIGKFNPRSYQVRTPTATIGVRGTDHEPLVIPQGSKEGEPGSYDKVNAGGSFIQTQHGTVDVKPNQAAFAPLHGRPVPRVLPQVPQFFRATRHEAVIAARHDTIHRAIDQRRDDRRKVFQEKKSQLEKQKVERQKAQQDRKQQWQENRQKRQQESGLHQREEREKRNSGAEERRKRVEDRRDVRRPEGDVRGRDRPQRNVDRDHGPRGGGRGRD